MSNGEVTACKAVEALVAESAEYESFSFENSELDKIGALDEDAQSAWYLYWWIIWQQELMGVNMIKAINLVNNNGRLAVFEFFLYPVSF